MNEVTPPEEFPINTMNEYIMVAGENLANHSTSLVGRGRFVRPSTLPTFRTRQEAYRFCAYALLMSDTLPDEPGEHTFEQVEEAIRNT
jgi:hypothetical protein